MPTLQQLQAQLDQQERTIADLSRQIAGLVVRPAIPVLRVKFGASKSGTPAVFEDEDSDHEGKKTWKFGEIEIYPRLPNGVIVTDDPNKIVKATYIDLDPIEPGHLVAYWPDISLDWFYACSKATGWTDP